MEHFCRTLENHKERVQRLAKDFCDSLGVTVFGYVRVYNSGRTSWVSSKPDQDRHLVESGTLQNDPLFDTKTHLMPGKYLWTESGTTAFAKERAKLFALDHGMVVVRHKKEYLETCCYSGLRSKRPLYDLFMNEAGLFDLFMDHFTQNLDKRLIDHLEEGVAISELKGASHATTKAVDREKIASLVGCKRLLRLAPQETRCLLYLREGRSYRAIGDLMGISPRTVEHYIESVKNKLGLETREELLQVAEQCAQLKFYFS